MDEHPVVIRRHKQRASNDVAQSYWDESFVVSMSDSPGPGSFHLPFQMYSPIVTPGVFSQIPSGMKNMLAATAGGVY